MITDDGMELCDRCGCELGKTEAWNEEIRKAREDAMKAGEIFVSVCGKCSSIPNMPVTAN